MRFILLFLVSIAFFGCKKVSNSSNQWLNAEVINTSDINCQKTLLSFVEDSSAIRSITGVKNLTYLANVFPTQYNYTGQKIKVMVANLSPGESFACITLGPNYPAIKVKDVRAR